MIDLILFTLATELMVRMVYGSQVLEELLQGNRVVGPGPFVIWNVLPAIAVIFCWSLVGATPGKKILRLKVLCKKRLAFPTSAQSVMRYLSYYLWFLPLGIGFLGHIVVGFLIVLGVSNKDRQLVHDRIAGTIVVRLAKKNTQREKPKL
tara:strand:+ start:442 stop:888 length:447 start_codon:yes stop_codon:yes gene_type:complete